MDKNSNLVYSAFSCDFVSPLFPQKGEMTKLSIAFSLSVDKAVLKYDSDSGLVFSTPLIEDGLFNGMKKYSAFVPVNNDDRLFRYYFAFFLSGASFYYSRLGITRYVPNINDRFSLITGITPPKWVSSSTCYQIFPDRFNNGDKTIGAKAGEYEFDGWSVTTPAWNEEPKEWKESHCADFYNGDLRGIGDKVEYLKSLSVDTIYLNPIFSSESVHRYDTLDFFSVDPKLGGDEALSELVSLMHENGIKVILDISINHTSMNGVWMKRALEDPLSKEREFFYFREDGTPESWQGVKTLPQLNYNSQMLRDYMYRNEDSVMKKYLKEPFSIDGWRLDVAPEVARRDKDQLTYEVWREINTELRKIKRDVYLVGEDWDDSSEYLYGDMWNGTMNYYGSGRPLREWMGECDRFLSTSFTPLLDKEWSGEELASALNEAVLSAPCQTPYLQMNLIDSHDTPRLQNDERVFDRDIYKGVLLALYILPGMPSNYYGDEILLKGKIDSNEGARYPMEWDEEKMDKDILSYTREIGRIRREYKDMAFSSSRVTSLSSGAILIERIISGRALLAFINKDEAKSFNIDLINLPKGRASVILGEGRARIEDNTLIVETCERKSFLILLED